MAEEGKAGAAALVVARRTRFSPALPLPLPLLVCTTYTTIEPPSR
jgi:hypothetical protein